MVLASYQLNLHAFKMSTVDGSPPPAVNALHAVTRAYRALRKWQASRQHNAAAATNTVNNSDAVGGTNGNMINIRQQQMLQQLSTVKRIAKHRKSASSRPCSAIAKQMPLRANESRRQSSVNTPTTGAYLPPALPMSRSTSIDRPQTPQLISDKLQLLKSPKSNKSNEKSNGHAEVLRGRSQSVCTPIIPSVPVMPYAKRSSVPELPTSPSTQRQYHTMHTPSTSIALGSPTRAHFRTPSVVLPSNVHQSAPATITASQTSPVLSPTHVRRPSALEAPVNSQQTPTSASSPTAALSPPASKPHHRGQPSYSQAITMAIDAVSPKHIAKRSSNSKVPTLDFSAAAALRLVTIESMDMQSELVDTQALNGSTPAVPRSTRKELDEDLDTPRSKLVAAHPSFTTGKTSKQLTAVLTDMSNRATPAALLPTAITPTENGVEHQQKAQAFVEHTADSSDSDEEDGNHRAHIEHNYMMGRRPSQQWLSWEDVIRQRKLSISSMPKLIGSMPRKQSKSRTKPVRQTSDSNTPSSVPSTPVAAIPEHPAATEGFVKYVQFQIRMHQMLKRWKKFKTADAGTHERTASGEGMSLQYLEAEFRMLDLHSDILIDSVPYTHGSRPSSISTAHETDSSYEPLTSPVKSLKIIQMSHASSMQGDVVEMVNGEDADEAIPHVSTVAPLELHDFVTVNAVSEPSAEDVMMYAQRILHMEFPADQPLLYIAKQALQQPVPPPFRLAKAFNTFYYVNTETLDTTFEDPADSVYYLLYMQERDKLWQQLLRERLQQMAASSAAILNLSHLHMTDSVFELLLELLSEAVSASRTNAAIIELDVSYNLLTDVSIGKLVKAQQLLQAVQGTLTALNLSHNRLGAHSVLYLNRLHTVAPSIKLASLVLSGNKTLSDVGVDRISHSMLQPVGSSIFSTLTSLSISHCGLTHDCVQQLAIAMQCSQSLESIEATDNADLSEADKSLLINAAQANKSRSINLRL